MPFARLSFLLPLALLTSALTAQTSAPANPQKLPLDQRWFYLPTNILVDANLEKAADLFTRAEKAHYTGVLLSDSKFGRLDTLDQHYFDNVAKLKKLAADHHLELIPSVFPIGWSNDILGHNPNLAEGLPVKDALFIVTKGEARPAIDPTGLMKGGDFANLKQWDWHDPAITADPENEAARLDATVAKGENARIVQKLALTPFHQYRFSMRIKTEQFRGTIRPNFLYKSSEGQLDSLDFQDWSIKPTQDWTTYTTIFNSLDHSEVSLYLGSWSPRTGIAWLADAKLEEAGLLNVLRRPGTPLVIKTEAGAPLIEGQDFAPVKDPKLGTVPWPGEYDLTHDPPAIKLLTNLPDGAKLRVSYYHPVITSSDAVMLCPSEPETVALLRDQAQRLHKLFNAKQYFMAHDEIRCMNWCNACQRRMLTPGEILADNVKTCATILKTTAPGSTLYVWSDMFDPHHNARNNYYLVNGDLAGSWKGLPKDVVIALWYLDKRNESMKFFADRGHHMIIAGYYDSDPANMNKWLDAAGKSKGVIGTIYTTWEGNYKQLEAFEQIVDQYRR